MNMSLSLYVHIPFCKSKCPYCSFVSFNRIDDLIEPYLSALRKEAEQYKGRIIDTVYIGGGTPTYLTSSQLGVLFGIIRSNFLLAQDAEITIEANPATFDAKKAQLIFTFGVNRVSLGVQSLNDDVLKYLGRPYTAKDAVKSVKILKDAGFSNINLDLIYSLPGETKKNLKEDVLDLVALSSQHISLYTFTVSEGSEFHRKKIKPPTAEKQGEDYLLVAEMLKRSGFLHYEVSNFAKTGYVCKHNLNYWQGGNYIGLGVAAHSHIDGHRFWNTDKVKNYINLIKTKGVILAGQEKLDNEKRFLEILLIGLRLTEGVDINVLSKKFKTTLPKDKIETIDDFVEHGLLMYNNDRIKATPAGMVVLDEICARLI